ncbi:unnamed protein product, partial [Rotaria sp. Silwood1]
MTSMSMNIKKQVQTVLDKIQCSGDFCGGGQLDVALPNVVIDGIEPLVFPLDEAQARKIINQCQLAPFGLRDKTLYDLRLIIPLDHEYTKASMKNGPLLKGKDAITGEIVQYACQNHQNHLMLYCVMVEQSDDTIKIQYYEPFGDPYEPFTKYCSILDYQHQEKISVSSTDLLDENIWNKLKLKAIEGPWTGNEAEYSHHWYNLSALLLLPEKYRYDLIVYPSEENGKLMYRVNYELWHVLNVLQDCKPSEDNAGVTSATLDLITKGILKSGFELADQFRIPLIQCLIVLALLNKTNQEVTITVKNLIAETLLIKPFFSAFSNSQYGMYERMADVLFGAGNVLEWTVIADQVLSLFHEELQSASYLSENNLENRIERITTFLSKFISLINTKRNDKENHLNEEETIALQYILTQMIEIFSAIVIQVVQQIISNRQQQTENQHKLEHNRHYYFYKKSTFSIKSLCSFLKIISMVDINSKINQSLGNINQNIQTLIDHDSTNGYQSVNSEYETTVD